MAPPTPSPLFGRLVDVWRHLSLRSDVDDIILELLGHFSLEKIYSGAGDSDKYLQLVISLLAKLNAIFCIQRLTLPAESVHAGRYLGFLASWEVTLRCVEFVLQVVVEGRESLWEGRPLRDKYLAEFLQSALRILTLHPKAPANQRARDRRDRFARIHRSLEQVFDSYPGPKSFLLEACKEVTRHLQADPSALALPPRLRHDLPNLTSELYPLAECLLPPYISELVPHDEFGNVGWLAQFIALRDVSQFVVGASVQYEADGETRDVRLPSSSARSRDAILDVLEYMRLPSHISKMEMISTFVTTFRTILPDTLDLAQWDFAGPAVDEYELDALDALCARLGERQIIHRVSDRDMMSSISSVCSIILHHDGPSGQHRAAWPGLYAMNCPGCHVLGASQLRSCSIKLPSDPAGAPEVRLPPHSECPQCGDPITIAREVPLARQAWELLRPLEPDADTINVEKHLPTRFQLGLPKLEATGQYHQGYSNTPTPITGDHHGGLGYPAYPTAANRGRSRSISQVLSSPQTPDPYQAPEPLPTELQSPASSTTLGTKTVDYYAQDMNYSQQEPSVSGWSPPPPPPPPDPRDFRRPSQARSEDSLIPPPTARTIPIVSSPEKGKSKWRMFAGGRKPSVGAGGDTSSLSEIAGLEAQRLEEISLAGLSGVQKSSAKAGKTTKSMRVYLSQNSTLALFWTQVAIHVWDVGSSPPTMMRAISTESTCILAAVGRQYLAYMIGNRDQKLTLRIVDLVQPSDHVVEYRISSSVWCKSIAIDRNENYVVIGFENSIVRFFKTTNTQQPREDRLHRHYPQPHPKDCKGCPPVDTLAFSNDGMVLLASTRNPKSGLIQIFGWRFPFNAFEELTSCRYAVPLHESEDNGTSAAIFRSGGAELEADLICITTWTQSGTPVLVQPLDGHRSEIKTDQTGRHSKLGSRIQCAAFSPSGRELAMVNDKGHLYQISSLNSSPMDIRRLATSKELTLKSDSFSIAFMATPDEEFIVLAWADPVKATGWVKKIPYMSLGNISPVPRTPAVVYVEASTTPDRDVREAVKPPVELEPPMPPVELPATPMQAAPPEKIKKIPRKRLGPGSYEQQS